MAASCTSVYLSISENFGIFSFHGKRLSLQAQCPKVTITPNTDTGHGEKKKSISPIFEGGAVTPGASRTHTVNLESHDLN